MNYGKENGYEATEHRFGHRHLLLSVNSRNKLILLDEYDYPYRLC